MVAVEMEFYCVDILTPSQWSEIHNSAIFNVKLGCIVSITFSKFTVCRLSDDWEEQLKLKNDLHINGISNIDISDHLNSKNYNQEQQISSQQHRFGI